MAKLKLNYFLDLLAICPFHQSHFSGREPIRSGATTRREKKELAVCKYQLRISRDCSYLVFRREKYTSMSFFLFFSLSHFRFRSRSTTHCAEYFAGSAFARPTLIDLREREEENSPNDKMHWKESAERCGANMACSSSIASSEHEAAEDAEREGRRRRRIVWGDFTV